MFPLIIYFVCSFSSLGYLQIKTHKPSLSLLSQVFGVGMCVWGGDGRFWGGEEVR